MTAAEIAAALGGAQRRGEWWTCRCPAHNDRSPSLSIRDGDRSLVVKCWAGCDPRDVLAELRRRSMIAGKASGRPLRSSRAEVIRQRQAEALDLADRKLRAQKIWDGATDAYGTPAATYLASRGIKLTPPASLRWAQYCWQPGAEDWLSAMLAAIVDVSGDLIGVHRTYLRPDGSGKADVPATKMMLGTAAGGSVHLAPAAQTLMVGEGIETCMAAMQGTEMPVWAALSTSGLVALVLPPIVRQVIILADNDASGAGERAARRAAARWVSEDRRVKIAMPPSPGTDMADVLVGSVSRPDEALHATA
jgi:putative DNA primase/helicase